MSGMKRFANKHGACTLFSGRRCLFDDAESNEAAGLDSGRYGCLCVDVRARHLSQGQLFRTYLQSGSGADSIQALRELS